MRHLLPFVFLLFSGLAVAQFPKVESSSALYNDLLKARSTVRILYLAAHPDDENTRLIAYFENGLHARTAYLSLNRGAGGQNLIGTEIGPAIGVLRTQELLRARSIDGGEQYFTRAVDFGYSKTAEETFEKWGKQAILSDVVRVIREFRPDVIVTRFPPTEYAGHGHHQASAILAQEAFDLAADPKAFPEQLDQLAVWQTKKLYFNASTWWNPDLPDLAKDNDDYLSVDVGGYDALLGESYAQIAARSRSSHASQGFGADYPYGSTIEYLRYQLGEKSAPGGGLLDGIDSGWENGDSPQTGKALQRALENYDFTAPQRSVPDVVTALKELSSVRTPVVDSKRRELEDLLLKVSATTLTLTTSQRYAVPGQTIDTDLMVNRATSAKMEVVAVDGEAVGEAGALQTNIPYRTERTLTVASDQPYSNPYWLNQPYDNIYKVEDPSLIGRPENQPSLTTEVRLEVDGYSFVRRVPLEYKEVDPTRGPVFAPVYVVPAVTFDFSENVVLSTGGDKRVAELVATAHTANAKGDVRIELPKGWRSQPEVLHFDLSVPGAQQRFEVTLYPLDGAVSGTMNLVYDGSQGPTGPALSMTEISYPHIPAQILLQPATVKLVVMDLERGGVNTVGYIDGPGDEVAKYLSAAGYRVVPITEQELATGLSPKKYDAIVTGIRAFNTREDLVLNMDKLNDYVKAGGTWLAQYNTTRGLKTDQIGPYPFTISRERVTEEGATARILQGENAVMNFPNKLSNRDFDNWVQERGLYFAGDWDKAFTPLIGWNDAGEPSRDGGLLTAPYGKGYFVYSGISFFRELPAGVSGAYRLLANILALGKSNKADND